MALLPGPIHHVEKAALFEHIKATFQEGRSEYHSIPPEDSGFHLLVHNDEPEAPAYRYLFEDGDQRDVVAFMRSGLYVFAPEALAEFLDYWASGLFVQLSLVHYSGQLIVASVRLHGGAG